MYFGVHTQADGCETDSVEDRGTVEGNEDAGLRDNKLLIAQP